MPHAPGLPAQTSFLLLTLACGLLCLRLPTGSTTQQAKTLAHLAQLTGTSAAAGRHSPDTTCVDIYALTTLIGSAAASGEQLAGEPGAAPGAAAPDGSAAGAVQAEQQAPQLIPAGWAPELASHVSPFAGAASRTFSATEEEEELAGEAAAPAAARDAVGASAAAPQQPALDSPTPRAAQLAASLLEIAASLSPTGASQMLERGESMVVPVVPASIYEHSLMARPDFSARCANPAGFCLPWAEQATARGLCFI